MVNAHRKKNEQHIALKSKNQRIPQSWYVICKLLKGKTFFFLLPRSSLSIFPMRLHFVAMVVLRSDGV